MTTATRGSSAARGRLVPLMAPVPLDGLFDAFDVFDVFVVLDALDALDAFNSFAMSGVSSGIPVYAIQHAAGERVVEFLGGVPLIRVAAPPGTGMESR
ncbi:hypothetical protein ABZX40_11460 [Streptomyces sp. NPDC004610]|uniref:hypothetical protein n=1 Tax=unclassified Streptomyces TaxID=2593676 RepID=UPI0033AE9EAA